MSLTAKATHIEFSAAFCNTGGETINLPFLGSAAASTFFASAPLGHKPVKTMLALEMQPNLDVHYMKLRSLDEGLLNHLDIFVIPAGIVGDYQRYFTAPERVALLKKFMDKGGRIFIDKSCENTAKMLKHSNLQSFNCNKSLIKAIK